MDGKLILVEGLPGSGKSSTAQFICDQLQRNGHKARWYYEDEKPHPVAMTRGLGHADDFQAFSRAVRRRWRDFVQRTARGKEIALIESHFFQDVIHDLLIRDVKPGLITAHVKAVAKLCAPLEPVLVYLHQPEYAPTMRRICDERGARIEETYIQRKENSIYGQRRGLTGFEGLVQFWLDVRKIMERLVRQLEMPKLSIDNTAQEWDNCYRQMCDFLSLSLARDEGLWRGEYLQRYAGTYTYQRDKAPRRIGGEWLLAGTNWQRRVGGLSRPVPQHYHEDVEFSIRLQEGELVMRDYYTLWPTNRLIPKDKDVCYIASLPFEMVFERDKVGEIAAATRVHSFGGRWLVTGQRYPRMQEEKAEEE